MLCRRWYLPGRRGRELEGRDVEKSGPLDERYVVCFEGLVLLAVAELCVPVQDDYGWPPPPLAPRMGG